MALNRIDPKIRIKRSTVSGTTPTIAPSVDHTNPTPAWSDTDIYSGEFFLNVPDERLWLGVGTGLSEIQITATASTEIQTTLDIGDWDMDSTSGVTVIHSLSSDEWKTIRGVSVIIRNDADSIRYDTGHAFGTTVNQAGVNSFDNSEFLLSRLDTVSGGLFDSGSFSAGTYNRGFVTFWYTPD